MIEKLSRKIGFTSTEIKVGVFLISTLIIGFAYKHFFLDQGKNRSKIIDLNESSAVLGNEYNFGAESDSIKRPNKKVDYKQEVLDFNKENFYKIKDKAVLKEKSINLNTAELSELVKLSGIGEKIAQKIIDYRNDIKKFDKIEEILNVKGIGNAKFQKIKKYIFVD